MSLCMARHNETACLTLSRRRSITVHQEKQAIALGVRLLFLMDGNAHTGRDLDPDVIQDTTHRPDDIRVNIVFVIEQEWRNPPGVEIRLPALIKCHNSAPVLLYIVE